MRPFLEPLAYRFVSQKRRHRDVAVGGSWGKVSDDILVAFVTPLWTGVTPSRGQSPWSGMGGAKVAARRHTFTGSRGVLVSKSHFMDLHYLRYFSPCAAFG